MTTVTIEQVLGAYAPQGTQGVQGPSGSFTAQGIQGIQGVQGVQGVQGRQGIQGVQGTQGVQGFQGTQGVQGTQGTQGVQGTQGIQGFQGTQGVQGIQGALSPWKLVTTTYSALNGDRIIADTSGGAFTVTLPASPTNGYYVVITDGYNWKTNNLTINPNGASISGISDNMLVDIGGMTIELVYNSNAGNPRGATWDIVATYGSQGVQGPQGPQGTQGTQGVAVLAPSNYVCQALLTSDQTIANASDILVTWNVADFDPNNWLNTSSNQIKPTIAGYYEISCSTLLTQGGTGALGQFNMQVRKNGNTIAITQEPYANSGSGTSLMSTRTVYLNGTTDYITTTVYNGSSSSVTLQHSNGTWLTVTLVAFGTQGAQGPQGGQGPQGVQGIPGSFAAQGIQGIQGPQGITGPAGSNTQIQYNNNSALGGAAGLLFINSSNTTVINTAQANLANIVTLNVSANISNTGNLLVTQNTFTGNLTVTQNIATGNILVSTRANVPTLNVSTLFTSIGTVSATGFVNINAGGAGGNNPVPIIVANYSSNTTGTLANTLGYPQFLGGYNSTNGASQFWGIGQDGSSVSYSGINGNVRIGIVGIDSFSRYSWIADANLRTGNLYSTGNISATNISLSGQANIAGTLNAATITTTSNIGITGTYYTATPGYIGGTSASVANNPYPFINYNYSANSYGSPYGPGMPQYIGAYYNANTTNTQFWGIGQCAYSGFQYAAAQGNVRIGIVGLDAYGHYAFINDANVRVGNLWSVTGITSPSIAISGTANVGGTLNVVGSIVTSSNLATTTGSHYTSTPGYIGGTAVSVANNPNPFINYNYSANTYGGIYGMYGMPQYIGAYYNANTTNTQFWGIGQCAYSGFQYAAGGTANVRIGIVGLDAYGHYTYINDANVRLGNLWATTGITSPSIAISGTANIATLNVGLVTTNSTIATSGSHYTATPSYIGGTAVSVANNPSPFINYNYSANTYGGIYGMYGMPQYIGAYYNANTTNTQFWGIGQCAYSGFQYAAGGTANVRIGIVGLDAYGHYTYINDANVRLGNLWATTGITSPSIYVSGAANVGGTMNVVGSITTGGSLGITSGLFYTSTPSYIGGTAVSVANNPYPFINYNYSANTYGGIFGMYGMPQYIGAYYNANTTNTQFWGIGQCAYNGNQFTTAQGNVRIGIVGLDAYGHYTYINDANVRLANLWATTGITSPSIYVSGGSNVGGTMNVAGTLNVVTSVLTSNGTVTSPTHTFGAQTNTGLYLVTTNTLGISTNGNLTISVSQTSVNIQSSALNVTSNTINVGTGSAITANGYSRLTNGLLFQWGNVSVTNANTVVTFPAAFTALFQVTATGVLLDGSATGTNLNVMPIITTSNVTAFNVRINSATANTVNWMAIGR